MPDTAWRPVRPEAQPAQPVLVVDAAPALHAAARTAAQSLAGAGRTVRLLHARSGGEALALARREPALAVALIGLGEGTSDGATHRLVRALRERHGRPGVQLILFGPAEAATALDGLRGRPVDGCHGRHALAPARIALLLAAALRRCEAGESLRQARRSVAEARRALAGARCGLRVMRRRRARARQALAAAQDTMAEQLAARTQAPARALADRAAFSRRVAHDLRGPLYGLSGLAGLVPGRLDRGDVGQVGAWAALMARQARGLDALLDGLQRLSEVLHVPLHLAPADLGALAEEARQEVVRRADGHAATVFDLAPLPTLCVDAALIRQLFVVLLSNAAKFSREQPAPCVRVAARAAEGVCTIEVRDNGIGLDPADLERIFEPLARVASAGDVGLGLGLAAARRIAQRHGGDIVAAAAPAGGALLRVTLPARRG